MVGGIQRPGTAGGCSWATRGPGAEFLDGGQGAFLRWLIGCRHCVWSRFARLEGRTRCFWSRQGISYLESLLGFTPWYTRANITIIIIEHLSESARAVDWHGLCLVRLLGLGSAVLVAVAGEDSRAGDAHRSICFFLWALF